MGAQQSHGDRDMSEEDLKTAFTFPDALNVPPQTRMSFKQGILSTYSIFKADDPDRELVKQNLENETFVDEKTDRAMGCFLGMVIGDALGAPFEFSPVSYVNRDMEEGFADSSLWEKQDYNRFDLRPGQWTDDASMGLCLADSLLVNQNFNGFDLRLRFKNWWELGYCNAFGFDPSRASKTSVGLGGNISESLAEFPRERTAETSAGSKDTSGNGSLMRNAAIPVYYANNIAEGELSAQKQSKSTHQGVEAAECCRLLTHICVNAINGDGSKKSLEPVGFETQVYSIKCLARGAAEKQHTENDGLKLEDRVWTWKEVNFQYSPNRSREQPGYIGSYAMDALAMALHCVWTTDSFKAAMLKSANLRGDSDSVTAVTGQLAGAIYGCKAIPKEWIKTILKWDPGYNIPLRAYKLYTHKTI